MTYTAAVRALMVVLACVGCVDGGDDTSDAAAQGAVGGPCFANSTCNAGLACVLVNGKGICEQESDATTLDAPADTTTLDAPSDTSGDVGADAGADACAAKPVAPCAGLGCKAQSKSCCENLNQCGVSAIECGNKTPWQCGSHADCSNNHPCCVNIQQTASGCPPVGQVVSEGTCATSPTACPGATLALCVTSADCPTVADCTPIKVNNLVIGLCM